MAQAGAAQAGVARCGATDVARVRSARTSMLRSAWASSSSTTITKAWYSAACLEGVLLTMGSSRFASTYRAPPVARPPWLAPWLLWLAP